MDDFNFKRYLEEKRDIINRGLADLLVAEDEYPQVLHRAMHYSLFAGGKRLRPVLVLASCEAVGGGAPSAVNTACAMECIHTYSLVHDDLPALDNDDLRRGRETCHKVYGEAMAILAGDALLTAAFEMIGETTGVEEKRLLKVLLEVARAAGSSGMIGGQVVDIESEGREITYPELEYIHIHKTGKLILASVRSGAILGGGDEEQLRALTVYGEAVGLAFQILDDILDVEGSAEELGKTTGGDEAMGKATYPSIIGLAASRERAQDLIGTALEALSGFGEEAEPLRALALFVVSRKS
ncbi:MAG: polyprenyl synthetase family protein [Thermodesulfobacteriota bacterium]|nr:MAG: polyprenyl synthetase family protein [Thermodesulfobacteriota bacterium]